MLSSTLRLRLIDQATDRLGDQLSNASLALFLRHLRRTDIDATDWQRCAVLAMSGACSHHQARAAAAQLVRSGLLERRVVARRVRGSDGRYTAYRIVPSANQEGAAQ
ncbi:hypothetical protein SAM9427_37220 (plasmid) [Streptomyces sp. ETH9427]|uniref:hypothetical protein n=1 Tax=Streptomyces sp. E1N211 TaxID=1851876 RepID=UPI000E0BFB7E|nr:hypothetical protein [Streptomyces sp. E1N211]AXI91410.1 hypothetical protein SAM9427_37220 [Streptomyces sp. ETH9427]